MTWHLLVFGAVLEFSAGGKVTLLGNGGVDGVENTLLIAALGIGGPSVNIGNVNLMLKIPEMHIKCTVIVNRSVRMY